MKKLLRRFDLVLISAALALLVSSGCSSTPRNSAQPEDGVQRMARVATVAELAAYTGAGYWLLEHPQDRDKVGMVVLALDQLGSTNGFNALALHQALSALPVKELKSDKGALIVGAAVLLYETELSRLTPIEQNTYVAIVASRVRSGLNRALEQTRPAPPLP